MDLQNVVRGSALSLAAKPRKKATANPAIQLSCGDWTMYAYMHHQTCIKGTAKLHHQVADITNH